MDEKYMEIALELAKRGIGRVNPNPLVGAVIVKENEIIGEGYHECYGEAHAERNAVKNATKPVEGSTIYVTLEPCAHYGKTPPCVDLIIEKKFKRVVIGMLDPNELVSGKSVEKLKEHGIEVVVGIKEKECKELNEIFIKYITSKIPFVILKSGMSIDGKIATYSGESKWITSKESREDSQHLRNRFHSIMVGVNTVIEDDPELTCRINHEKKLIRIIVDSNLRIPLDSKVLINNDKAAIVATTLKSDEEKKKKLRSMGIKVIEVEDKDNRVNLKELVKRIGEEGIDSILIEGGGTLNFSALEERIVDKVRFYIAPKIIGGENSRNSIAGKGFFKLDDAVRLKDINYRTIGEDLVLEGYVAK
ncbi:bifunctional diaminohydroxyphosphoribosylaminopyrimidine deaminase/5-amino-6-(5-phosphoribosylamino)uracil reductase RibD [Clostridium beijerinckii]|uniref:bifunctional diaminohydroxyphosphoribosylaminopyrimidine deaminase/5-amino-6-(5-phosphoribosylamino)uracil reductase RibD n=1 Tax=Clostridium beijerinckii TaxID=1520 RepID=UPI00098BDD94|nr:bifunctional diaminohydroxyphosphoribosylaminopyrimidine deaminase/5-amino-6-(5-phosphoribosylamino)uracil reductase RibD [Clostridium beijerinckii]MBA8936841.1 diaminohydroxyphosphoribosylaminopyrimidine deaminase/5-amino-6-(5-phosphoribosylamino)uracil reductase [Clostridium beijerinckii]NRT33604.1 diaminohydroxyphosphoribosylaminopyrimidine deaminase/5-amino-6-(5-phosphoribosylamino)uracil reductase [Clostridium beijerinckii]NRT46967.1 diaminohydroxyphosphoribosylaminopyrimidine deaminase/